MGITNTALKSLKRTVAKGYVKISAKLNFVGTYFNMIFCLLDSTSPQNLTRMSICFVRLEWVELLCKTCMAGSLSVLRTVHQSISGYPKSNNNGCNHSNSLHASTTWIISDSVLDRAWTPGVSSQPKKWDCYPEKPHASANEMQTNSQLDTCILSQLISVNVSEIDLYFLEADLNWILVSNT